MRLLSGKLRVKQQIHLFIHSEQSLLLSFDLPCSVRHHDSGYRWPTAWLDSVLFAELQAFPWSNARRFDAIMISSLCLSNFYYSSFHRENSAFVQQTRKAMIYDPHEFCGAPWQPCPSVLAIVYGCLRPVSSKEVVLWWMPRCGGSPV